MNIRTIKFAVGIAVLAIASSSFGQVIIRGTETTNPSSSNSASTSAVTVDTGDRDIVPLIKETRDTKVDATTQRDESVTRARLSDGSYFDWQRSTTVTKDISPNQSVSSTDLVEKDRQGQSRVSQHSDVTVAKSASGETDQTKAYKRDSSGNLILDHVVDADTVKGRGGVADTTSVEKTADVNGGLSTIKQVDSVTVNRGPNDVVTTAETRMTDHMDGQLDTTVQKTTSTTTQGAVNRTDSVIQVPGELGLRETSHTTTTETKAPDGSVTRETIVDGRPAYSGNNGGEPLGPQTKVVEHEVHNPNGTTAVERDVLHLDVNGNWVPESFSTKDADKALSGASDTSHVGN